MNQKLLQILFWVTFVFTGASYAQIQSINLSTGVMLSNGSWGSVTMPSGAVQTPLWSEDDDWAESGCSHWIRPHGEFGMASVPSGTYTYRLTFTISNPRIDCAKLVINAIGADNKLTGLYINSNNYTPIMPGGNNHFNPLTTNQTLYVNPAHLINGTNTLTVTTYNNPGPDNSNTMSGLNFCGRLVLNDPNFGIVPDVTGPAGICQGSPLTFGGALAPGSNLPTHYYWRLLECDAAGNLVNGGYSWESLWFTGVPSGNYTFPSNLNLTCGKYYMAVLSAVRESGCSNWSQDLHVFKYNCKPTVNAGADQTICQSECVTIGPSVPSKQTSYSWSSNGAAIGTGFSLYICPQTTTTYILTATDNTTGCSNTDPVVVNVLPNNPDFDIETDSYNDYFTVTATPVVMNANNVPGFGAYWAVEELDANNNYVFYIQNPTGWWPYPASCSFKGFDDYLLDYSGIVTTLPNTPAVGRFVHNKTYRITRGTWNNNCEWNAISYTFEKTKSANGEGEIVVTKTKAPAFRPFIQQATESGWSVSPNPSNGVFNIFSQSEETQQTVFEVFDLFGKKIESKAIEAGTTSLSIDLRDNAKGVYILNITIDGVVTSHKIIVE